MTTKTVEQVTAEARAEWRANQYGLSVSEDQYIAARLVDEGLASLDWPTAAATGTKAPADPATWPTAAEPAPGRGWPMAPTESANVVDLAADPANWKFVAEFDGARAALERMGLTREQYIRTRRIDERLEQLC